MKVADSPPARDEAGARPRRLRRRTPTVIQMEAVECGAASLAMILASHGRWVPLEELRAACGVSRDGSKASNILKAARGYGLTARGMRCPAAELGDLHFPLIGFWRYCHWLVIEGYGKGVWHLNDPATGPREVSDEEFHRSYSGVALELEAGPAFVPGGRSPSLLRALRHRAHGLGAGLAYAVAAGVCLALLGIVLPAFTRIFVDDVLIAGRHSMVVPLLWAMGLTAVLYGGLTWLQQHVLVRLQLRLAVTTSARFLRHLLGLPIAFYAQRYAGEVGSRLGFNDRVAQLLSGQLATNLLAVLVSLFYIAVMLQYDTALAALAILLAAANLVALAAMSARRKTLNSRLQQERGKLLATTMEGLLTIETLKASGGEEDFFAQWAGRQARSFRSEQALGVATQVLNAVPLLLTMLNTTAVLGLGGVRVMEGHLSAGELVAFQGLVTAFMTPVNNLVALGSELQELDAQVTRLDDVLANPAEDPLAPSATPPTWPPGKAKLSGGIELRGVTFGYSRLAEPLIRDLDLSVAPGGRVALVGGSGSGKSTISKLIAGLYEPWSGEIRFDGVSASVVPCDVLRASLALVDQDILLFEGSVRDNLTLWDTTAPDESVVRAAQDACVHDVIAGRAGGYQAVVAERASNFSGGQRQRLEIARALQPDPSIVILDEATSALDPLTEKEIDDNLRRRGCTCIIVAHRLSTIRDCDEIIVLERGQVVERGTHDEMIATGGPYARLIAEA